HGAGKLPAAEEHRTRRRRGLDERSVQRTYWKTADGDQRRRLAARCHPGREALTLKPSEIRTLVLETLLEYERVKDGKKPKNRKKAKNSKAKKTKAAIDIPAFLPKISDEALIRASS